MIQGGKNKGAKRQAPISESWKEERVIFQPIMGGPCLKKPLIITALISHYRNAYIFVDQGSMSDIMYQQYFDPLDAEDKARLEPVNAPISGFSNEDTHLLEQLKFLVTLSDGKNSWTKNVEFLVLPEKSKHDLLLGREANGDQCEPFHRTWHDGSPNSNRYRVGKTNQRLPSGGRIKPPEDTKNGQQHRTRKMDVEGQIPT